MKYRNLTPIAVAVVAALGAGNAHALSRVEYASAVKVYFGGATATDNVLEAVFLAATGDGLCDATLGNIDVWRAANQRVVTCFLSQESTSGNTSFATRANGGTPVAFHKESEGGSSNGVVPLIQVAKGLPHSLGWLNVGALANDCTVGAGGGGATGLLPYTNHSGCTLDATTRTPADTAASSTFDVNGGISDNEPALADPKPTAAEIARLTSVPGIQIVFGVPVTTKLYRALQEVQFTDLDCTSDTNPALHVDSRDLPKCLPSLEQNQVSGIYSGRISSWDQLVTPAGTSLTQSALVTDKPADDLVRICRRVAASGTQATAEALNLNQRCATGVFGFLAPDDFSTVNDTINVNPDFTQFTVNANPSSGNVRSCLKSANTGDYWGVGVLSTEVKASDYGAAVVDVSPAGGEGFRFVAINGAAPNLVNVANGSYQYFSENTVNRVKDGAGAITGVRLSVVTLVSSKLGNVDALSQINTGFNIGAPWGLGGVLALPSIANPNTPPFTAAEVLAKPVSTQTRGGNTCNFPNANRPQPAKNR